MPETEAEFRPIELLRTLVDGHVEFILVGGLAAVVHGAPVATTDVDIVPRRERANLERLSAALHELDARVYVDRDEVLRFEHDGASLGDAAVWNLATRYGGLDVTFEPAGTRGFADLAARAEKVDLDGLQVSVAALEDVIRSKSAADRDKDRAALPTLRRLADLIDEGGSERLGRLEMR